MRLRFAVPAALLATLAAAVAPGLASAAPHHNRGLTIRTFPNPSNAGDEFLVVGRLTADPVEGKKIILYRHFSGSTAGYEPVLTTTTLAGGYYLFDIKHGIDANQCGFVIAAGHPRIHSRTVCQRVRALVSLSANPLEADTLHPVLFTGHVTPKHNSEHVLLQVRLGDRESFRTVKNGALDTSSDYSIRYRFPVPGAYEVRVVFPGDVRNVAGKSDTVTVTVQQSQNPFFTIKSSSPITTFNTPVTISGTLSQPGAARVMVPEGMTSVTLMGRGPDQESYFSLGSTVTGPDGGYSFTQSPTANELYKVCTTLPPRRCTAPLFQGVRDEVTLMAMPGPATSAARGSVTTFTGTVTPDKAGRRICLQRRGTDGEFHNVTCTSVSTRSTYELVRAVFDTGTFRTRIGSDRFNLGNVSPEVTVNGVLPPASAVPTGS